MAKTQEQEIRNWEITDGVEPWLYRGTLEEAKEEAQDLTRCDDDAPTEWWDVAIFDADAKAKNPDIDPVWSKEVAVHPPEPPCEDGGEHDWQESGPFGDGAGTIWHYTCPTCNWRRTEMNNCQHGAEYREFGIKFEKLDEDGRD